MEEKKNLIKSTRLVKDRTKLNALPDSLSGGKLQNEKIPMNVQHDQKGEAEIIWEDSCSQYEPLVPDNGSEDNLNPDFRKKYKNHM